MRLSKYLLPTLRESPAEAEIISHQYLLRGGYIRKVAAGIYDYLPLGLRVLNKVKTIIVEEMNRAGAMEVLLPVTIPGELWKESGRWDFYGKELLRFKDRKDTEFCLGPTHEEVITDLVKHSIQSYRQLPINLYQINTKFRDEIRPRFGLMRGREFLMKDAYSFHASQADLDREYQNMYETYCRIFERCGLQYKVVEADSGAIGGSASQEFMVLAETGEDALISCNACNYAANVEAAANVTVASYAITGSEAVIEEVATPTQKTIEEVSQFLKVPASQTMKALMYWADNHKLPVLVLLRGDRELNEIKLKKFLKANQIALLPDEDMQKQNFVAGFLSPIGMDGRCRIVADQEIAGAGLVVTGANKAGFHIKNALLGRDFNIKPENLVDLRIAVAGDSCARCKTGSYVSLRGIEVGHIFKLGTKYSQAMQARYLDEKGKEQPYIMGCYGIGVGRTMASAIEQNNDAFGPIWPKGLAPFQVIVLPANVTDVAQKDLAEKFYREPLEKNIDVILDDRDERLGVKLKDADLMGVPLKVIIGKSLADGNVEIKKRNEKDSKFVKVETATSEILSVLA
jgi:prolyl-tRNA synthetase